MRRRALADLLRAAERSSPHLWQRWFNVKINPHHGFTSKESGHGKGLGYQAGVVALALLGGYAVGVSERGDPQSQTRPHPLATTAHAASFERPTVPLSGCLSPYFIADAAAKASPAVVNILVQHKESPVPVGSSGSGFIVDTNGTVLTNAHVIADVIKQRKGGKNAAITHGNIFTSTTTASPLLISVTLQDGRIFEANLVHYDILSDIAVLKLQANVPLPAVRLGQSAGLRAGEWVVALGSPLHLQNSVTAGIVSCVGRKSMELGLGGGRTEYIQTDASINRGSSGGPLVNLAGEVIGVSCMKALAADGVSFAIPIDYVREVVMQLETHGRVIRPYLGVKLLQLNRHNAAQFRARDPNFPDVMGGILVPDVQSGSPAEKAGLRQGDVIVEYEGCGHGGNDITTAHFVQHLGANIGKPLQVTIIRSDGHGGSVKKTLHLIAQEAPPS